jgi:hypothetical protein
MVSKGVKALIDASEREAYYLRGLSENELKQYIKKEADTKLPDIPLGGLALRFLKEDPSEAVNLLPAAVTHNAIADYLADGGELPADVIKWFAERVKDPKLLQQKAGRKPAYALHHTIRRFIKILSEELDFGVEEAMIFVADAVGRGETYIRDIWYKKNKLSDK